MASSYWSAFNKDRVSQEYEAPRSARARPYCISDIEKIREFAWGI